MKNPLCLALFLCFILAACSKSNSKISTTFAPGISVTINGKKTTFNNFIYMDTTQGELAVNTEGDSAGFTGTGLSLIINPFPIKTGLYPNANMVFNSDNNSSELGANTSINGSQVLFGSYDDSVTVTAVTDSTVVGTFHGHMHGQVLDQNSQSGYRDSVITCTDGKFNIKY